MHKPRATPMGPANSQDPSVDWIGHLDPSTCHHQTLTKWIPASYLVYCDGKGDRIETIRYQRRCIYCNMVEQTWFEQGINPNEPVVFERN